MSKSSVAEAVKLMRLYCRTRAPELARRAADILEAAAQPIPLEVIEAAQRVLLDHGPRRPFRDRVAEIQALIDAARAQHEGK